MLAFLPILLLGSSGCGPPLGLPRVIIQPGDQRTGLEGTDGPFGAAAVEARVRARVSDVFRAEILYPSDEAGALHPEVQGAPMVLLEHGGLVAPARYRWLGAHFATRGYVVLLPDHPAQLAILEPDNGLYALEELERLSAEGPELLRGAVDPSRPVTAAGHSLGGVVAARQWAREPGALQGLAMLASWPAPGDPVADRGSDPVLVISGSTDASAPPEEVQSHHTDYGSEPWFALVEGLNHYGWTDQATAGELGRDGPLEGDLSELRQNALRVLDAYLDGVRDGDVAAALPDEVEGVELSW